jgi:hypothetical protein
MVITVVSACSAVYFYFQAKAARQNSPFAAQDEIKKILSEVEKLMILPEGEEPTIATVTDLEPLKNQPFFRQAAVGDKVIVYSIAGKAILYRQSSGKIVEVAPITPGANAASNSTPPPSVTPSSTQKSTTTTATSTKSNP